MGLSHFLIVDPNSIFNNKNPRNIWKFNWFYLSLLCSWHREQWSQMSVMPFHHAKWWWVSLSMRAPASPYHIKCDKKSRTFSNWTDFISYWSHWHRRQSSIMSMMLMHPCKVIWEWNYETDIISSLVLLTPETRITYVMMLVHPCKMMVLHTIFAHIGRHISPFPLLYPNTFWNWFYFSMVLLKMAMTIVDVTDAADNLETDVFDKSKNTVVTFKASEDL